MMDRQFSVSFFTSLCLLALASTIAACSPSSSGGSSQAAAVGPDPLKSYQWYLFSDGGSAAAAFSTTVGGKNHANVLAVHEDLKITGAGITVNVVDTGLQLTHPDLRTNQANSFDYLENDNNPQPISSSGDHGTSVAGIIGMKKNNAIGGVGVAPDVTLIGHAFVGRSKPTLKQYAVMMGLDSAVSRATEIAQIYNQSFGVVTTQLGSSADQVFLSNIYETGVKLGRSSKGYIYIKSAGNDYEHSYKDGNGDTQIYSCNSGKTSCSTSSQDFSNTLPENIIVSATKATGKLTSYSTTGAGVWVSAPGGEFGYGDLGLTAGGLSVWDEYIKPSFSFFLEPAMVTTDVTGCSSGYSKVHVLGTRVTADTVRNLFEYGLHGASPLNRSCDYTSTFNGTSSAAPVVSGVVALMLEANPQLGWRDVKHILATTSDKIDSDRADFVYTGIGTNTGTDVTIDHSWTTNAANHSFSNHYGFGQVNGYQAVLAARDYTNYLTDYTADTSSDNAVNMSIPDNSTDGTSDSLALSKNLIIESVRVTVTIKGGNPFDLALVLESPQGTRSSLLPSGSAYEIDTAGYSINDATFLTNAFYEERSQGTWTLRVYDLHSSDNAPFANSSSLSTLEKWSIEINGHPTP